MPLLYFFLLFYIPVSYAVEYVYPVACLDDDTILYIHQQTPTHIELFQWNTITNQHTPLLWSLFNPAGLQLLPNQLGFSFIDNGRLRIKAFQKRSPKAVEFDEPIYNINGLQWIDDHTCYCSAQQGDYFSLFELSDNGDVRCLAGEPGKDYMYPQKVDNSLFYIERTMDQKHTFNYRIIQYSHPYQSSSILIDFQDKPIIFLHMITQKEGFVLEHAPNIDDSATTIQFFYHQIINEKGGWKSESLFTFFIPTNLVGAGNERIYESLLPLLPRPEKERIYFADCSSTYWLKPYYYNTTTRTTEKIKVPNKKGHYFVPWLCKSTLYCGGTKDSATQNSFISLLT
jgi:hypothetical protein